MSSSNKAPSPIGILDSGLGGLSVLNEVHQIMPEESVIYFGDSAWCPYGAKTAEQIQQRVFKITDYLLGHGCKLIIIACNSATIAAVEALRSAYPIPFVGMEPGIKPAVTHTKTGVIGVLATEASLAGEKFHRLVNNHAKDIKVITRPCPSFVELVENGELKGTKALSIVKKEIDPLTDAGADVLVLGCTHYPFLRPLIQQAAGSDVHLIDTGQAVTKRTAALIPSDNITEKQTSLSSYEIITSGNLESLTSIFPSLCEDIDTQRVKFLRHQI